MIVELLNCFDPDPEVLLRVISSHVDDEMLLCISDADYGTDAVEHFVALERIRDDGIFPVPVGRLPSEVLELIRWSEPEDPSWKPGEIGELGHWMRAFSCAALLRAIREPWNYGGEIGTDSTLVQLLLSLQALPVDFTPQAVKFLAWLLLHSELEGEDEEFCSFAVGLLWLALQHPMPIPDETLTPLAQWILRRAEEVDFFVSGGAPGRGLRNDTFGPGLSNMVLGCQKRSSWERLGRGFRDLDLSRRSSEMQNLAHLIGKQLAG